MTANFRATLSDVGVRTLGWTGSWHFLYKRPRRSAQVAQLVEQRTENPCVGGSIPPLGTTFPKCINNSCIVLLP
jgi:hypothetical protein